MPRPKQIPQYGLHKTTGQARVRIDGKDHYLGVYGSQESRQTYSRLIAEYCRPGGGQAAAVSPSDPFPLLSINELFVRYLGFAETYYVSNGVPTGETANMKDAMKSVRTLYELKPAREFGPLALKAVRQHMIEVEKLCRRVINSRINRIRRIFKWAVSEELIPSTVYEGLRALEGLRYGRSTARETDPVGPVDDATVHTTIKFLPPVVADMVRLERLTSMRPGNVVTLRWADIDCTGDVWLYRPPAHKTQYLGRQLAIPLGPKAKIILQRYRHRPPHLAIFSPQKAQEWRKEQRRKNRDRKTRIFPCELRRLERERKQRRRREQNRAPGEAYTTASFHRAIQYAVKKAQAAGLGISSWHPNQLRHSRATEIRRQFGLEGAQVVLGHTRADVTQVYAERDLGKAVEIARMTG